MSKSTAAKNKAIVLEAFDTLFNKRDYATAERFWSPNYIQHRTRRTLRTHQESAGHAEIRARHDRGRRQSRDRSRTLFQIRSSSQLDSRRHPSPGKRGFGRALGCHSRRSNTCAIQERESDVRQFIPRLGTSTISTALFRRRTQALNGLERKESSYAAIAADG